MADPAPTPPTEPANPLPPAAAVSPTGQAVVPPAVLKWLLPLVTIAGGIAIAPQMGFDLSFLPPAVMKASTLIAFIGAMVGLAGPGVRKVVPMVLLLTTIGLSSCAHASPIVVTGEALDGAALTFEATAAGMLAADQAHALTLDQVHAWNAFRPRFLAGYHLACKLWRAARETGDAPREKQAAAILQAMLEELGSFTSVVLAAKPGGAS